MGWVFWAVAVGGVAICGLLAYVGSRIEKLLDHIRGHLKTLIAEGETEAASLIEIRDHLHTLIAESKTETSSLREIRDHLQTLIAENKTETASLMEIRDHLQTLIAENKTEIASLGELRDHLSKIVHCSENAPWIVELREAGQLPASQNLRETI